MKYLSMQELCAVGKVCSKWRELSQDQSLWSEIARKLCGGFLPKNEQSWKDWVTDCVKGHIYRRLSFEEIQIHSFKRNGDAAIKVIGKFLVATFHKSRFIRVFDLELKKIQITFEGAPRQVNNKPPLLEGYQNRLVTGDHKGVVKIIELPSGIEEFSLKGCEEELCSLKVYRSFLIVITINYGVHIWNLNDQSCLFKCKVLDYAKDSLSKISDVFEHVLLQGETLINTFPYKPNLITCWNGILITPIGNGILIKDFNCQGLKQLIQWPDPDPSENNDLETQPPRYGLFKYTMYRCWGRYDDFLALSL